jgi:hypothetical protein
VLPAYQGREIAAARVGFTFVTEIDFEYPPGTLLRCNDWRLDLTTG